MTGKGQVLPCHRGIGLVRCTPGSGPRGSGSGSTPLRRKGPLPRVWPKPTLHSAKTTKRMESEMAHADSITPVGVNHVVLNVRDIEESHRFWTEIVGLKQVSELRPRPEMPNMPKMRFY